MIKYQFKQISFLEKKINKLHPENISPKKITSLKLTLMSKQ